MNHYSEQNKRLRSIPSKSLPKSPLLFILLTGTLTSFISFFSAYQWFLSCKVNSFICFFNIILTWFFIYLWDKIPMYRHHFLALGMIFIICIIQNSILYNELYELTTKIFESFLLWIIMTICLVIMTSAREVIQNHLMIYFYMNHSTIMLCEGLILIVLVAIIFIIVQLINCDHLVFFLEKPCSHGKWKEIVGNIKILFNFKTSNPIVFFVAILLNFATNYFRIYLNKKSGPTFRYTGDAIGFQLFLICFLLAKIYNCIMTLNWFYCIEFIPLLIACLLYNEIIRLYLCDMSINTRFEIEARLKAENEIMIRNYGGIPQFIKDDY